MVSIRYPADILVWNIRYTAQEGLHVACRHEVLVCSLNRRWCVYILVELKHCFWKPSTADIFTFPKVNQNDITITFSFWYTCNTPWYKWLFNANFECTIWHFHSNIPGTFVPAQTLYVSMGNIAIVVDDTGLGQVWNLYNLQLLPSLNGEGYVFISVGLSVGLFVNIMEKRVNGFSQNFQDRSGMTKITILTIWVVSRLTPWVMVSFF